jgi:DNA invertase Pin-like site-specific DNA recombinase
VPPSRSSAIPAAIYTRISLDRSGASESPERQEAEARRLCDAKGWEVIEVFSDRDLSAYKRGVRRPAYEAMQAAVADGRVRAVAVYSLTRLARSVQEFSRLLEFLTSRDCALASVSDPVDTSTPSGRAMTQLHGVFAELESATISTRVRSAHAFAAERGRAHSGGSRSFGYARDGSVVEEEAEVVREVAARVADGASLRSLARDLNARGVRTTMENEWSSATLGQMLRSPRLAGLRTHNGDVTPGDWEAILDPEQHAAVLEALSRSLAVRRSTRRHLLTGLAVCGLCGGKLKTMGFHMKNGQAFERYQCVAQPGSINCGKIAAAKNSLDATVLDELLTFLSRADLRPVEGGGRAEALRRLAEDDGRALVELTQARFVHRSIGDEEYVGARDALRARVDAADAELAALQRQEAAAALALRPGRREDLEAWWEGASAEDRRAALAASVERIVVMPAKRRGGNVFDRSRVHVEFRLDLYRRAVEGMSDEAYAEAAVDDGAVPIVRVRRGRRTV